MGNVQFKKSKELPKIIEEEEEVYDSMIRKDTHVQSILMKQAVERYTIKSKPFNQRQEQYFPNSINSPISPTTILYQHTVYEDIAASLEQVNSSPLGKNLDIDECIDRLIQIGVKSKIPKSICFKQSEIIAICKAAQEVFMSQSTLLEINAPVKIMGDIHGQYQDLIRLFQLGGYPPDSNYLLLGDYVDRGKQSLETILLLFCFKIKYPENFFLLRGNHECADVTKIYGFYDECKRRANVKVWRTFMDVFNTLPIAGLVANKIFCVHGGISPNLTSMDEIRRIVRPTDVPERGLINDLLWSDPSETTYDWEENDRGAAYLFGKKAVNDFLATFNLELICRAHMVVEDGYQFFNDRTLVTVFSAANYCGEFNNLAAIMSIDEELTCSFQLLQPQEQSPITRSFHNFLQYKSK